MNESSRGEQLDVRTVPLLLSDMRCFQCGQLLGSEPFWCLTCNAYVEMLMKVQYDHAKKGHACEVVA